MAKKSSINIDLNDPRAGKIADVLNSKTAKKILDLIADRGEMSGSDISNELDMPLNTVTYNLKKLVDAGLVGKSKKFFWSSKGKKMELYKVLNKQIIISPRALTGKVTLGILGVLAILAVAIFMFPNNSQTLEGVVDVGSFEGVRKFSSYDELEGYLNENAGGSYGGFGLARSFDGDDGIAVEEFAVASDSSTNVGAATSAIAPVPSVAQAKGESAGSYSETNIQVEGVDEPDIVKNDGKYIYVVQDGSVFIIDAFPAEEMRILDEIKFDEEYISNIFVNEDRLIVFGNEYEYIDTGIRCGEFFDFDLGVRCGGYSREYTNVYVYDISDRGDVELDEKLQFDGNYNNARMVGDFVYLITTKYINLNYLDLPVHNFGGVERSVAADEIFYFDSPDGNYIFTTIAAIEVDSQRVESETFLMGQSGQMYMSEDNIYLTYQKQLSQSYYFDKFVEDVLLEILPSDESEMIEKIMDSDGSYREKGSQVGEVFENYRRSLDREELIDFVKDYQKLSEDFYEEVAKQREMSVIQRISVDDFEINYEAEGEVPGRILNQFSMDEFDGTFRVATTTGGWNRDNNLNHLFVLDMDLDIIGSVEDLAKGEQIYSARFMGERAFVVTFRQTDPLFAIDLSEPENPKVLGELKITGFSNYLHPVSENLLLGIGREASEEGRQEGVKVSLFDISDLENPKEISKHVVQGQWSYTEAEYEHKAVLFDKEKELLVIPISITFLQDGLGDNSKKYEHWQGAYVFRVTETEVEPKKIITHQREGDDSQYYYNNWGQVRRSLFMDDVLYTISDLKVLASSLDDYSEINDVDFPKKRNYPVYYADGGFGGEVSIRPSSDPASSFAVVDEPEVLE